MNPAEEVARWLHETFNAHFPLHANTIYDDLEDLSKNRYLALAEGLLTNPPPVLVKAAQERSTP